MAAQITLLSEVASGSRIGRKLFALKAKKLQAERLKKLVAEAIDEACVGKVTLESLRVANTLLIQKVEQWWEEPAKKRSIE
eukprot:8445374-Lingulodinium_polyedra.AAC.1